jgi:hypothetical protein
MGDMLRIRSRGSSSLSHFKADCPPPKTGPIVLAHGLHCIGEDELVVAAREVEGGVAYFSDVVEHEAIVPIPANTIVPVKTRLISLFIIETPKMNENLW